MVKSTAGTWVNYATTAMFQVLFARRFGATNAASAYALTFTISVGLWATFVGTTQLVYLPRLRARSGEVLTAVLGRMGRLTCFSLVIFAVVAAGASLVAPVIAPKLDHPGIHLAGLIRLACLFGFSQVLVGQLAAVCWARGARFVPAVAPVCPSIIASIPLLTDARVSTSTLYVTLTVGSLLQIILLAPTAARGLRLSREPYDRRGEPPTLVSLGAFAVAQLIVPFEVLIAAHASATGGADFNYAYRAIVVVQALIVGGIVAAALPDWSDHVRTEARVTLERSIARTVSMAALALSLAAAVGLVAAEALVRVTFQRGSFTAHDTRVVSAIIIAALVGFVAEGIMLVLSQAILADRRTRAAIAMGMARTAVVMLFVSIFGLTSGPVGVAIGYSAGNVISLAGEIIYVWRKGILTRRQAHLARSTLLVTICTGAAATLLLSVNVPPLLRAAFVLTVFASVAIRLRNSLPKLRTPST
jgi:putative peptidoglycan lipid II flippase